MYLRVEWGNSEPTIYCINEEGFYCIHESGIYYSKNSRVILKWDTLVNTFDCKEGPGQWPFTYPLKFKVLTEAELFLECI